MASPQEHVKGKLTQVRGWDTQGRLQGALVRTLAELLLETQLG